MPELHPDCPYCPYTNDDGIIRDPLSNDVERRIHEQTHRYERSTIIKIILDQPSSEIDGYELIDEINGEHI